MNQKIVFGILLAILTVLTAPAAAQNCFYLVPENSSCDEVGCTTTVWVMLNSTYTGDYAVDGGSCSIDFDPAVVNITNVEEGTDPNWIQWKLWHMGTYVHISFGDFGLTPGYSGEIQLGKMTVECKTLGVSPLEFVDHYPDYILQVVDHAGDITTENYTVKNGTFTCGDIQTFTKSLPEGWNLISLPLTATDNSVGTVLSGVTQNAVKRYDATTKLFEEATTMDPGVGYFVHVTESGGSTWSYQGSPVTSTNPGLKSGLNMIGVPNCTMSVDTAMGTTDYRYVARWNAATQEYEVYNPVAPSAFHGFTEMAAGEGYFVSAKSDCALNINCPG